MHRRPDPLEDTIPMWVDDAVLIDNRDTEVMLDWESMIGIVEDEPSDGTPIEPIRVAVWDCEDVERARRS
jgi:hypothetical protein